MGELTNLLEGYGNFILFIGFICFFYGTILMVLELKYRRPKSHGDRSVIPLLAGLLALICALVVWMIEPIRFLLAAAVMGLCVGVVTVVGIQIISSLVLAPISE